MSTARTKNIVKETSFSLSPLTRFLMRAIRFFFSVGIRSPVTRAAASSRIEAFSLMADMVPRTAANSPIPQSIINEPRTRSPISTLKTG